MESMNWMIAGIVLVFISVGISLGIPIAELHWKIAVVVIGEVGFAIIIAFVFSQTVEKYARQEYNSYIQKREKELSRNIFSYLYNVDISRNLYNYIEKAILIKSIYREQSKIEYELLEEKSDWVLVRFEFECIVRNISSEKQSYPFLFFVESSPVEPPVFDTEFGVCKFHFIRDYTNEEIRAADVKEPDDEYYHKYKFNLELDPGQAVPLRMTAYSPRQTRDHELWRTSVSCDGLIAKVRYDPHKYHLQLVPLHAGDGFVRKEQEGRQLVAEINDPLLPRNGIYFWWTPKLEPKDAVSAV